MFKRFLAALAAITLLAGLPARADYVIRDGQSTPAQQTFGSFSLSGVQFPKQAIIDPTTGAALGVSANPFAVRTTGSGVGALTAVPAGSTNGTALGTCPATAKGARLYVPPGASLSFTIAAAQPSSAPSAITVANPSTNTVPANWDEDLSGGQAIYVTASSGSNLYRCY